MMSGGTRQPGDTVGGYRLLTPVSEGQLTRTWKAEQISMQRPVVLEMLKVLVTRDPGIVGSFLADVRAKALVSHPGIGSVYEAVNNDKATFFAREKLEGDDLEALHDTGKKITPVEIVKLLGKISGAMMYLENEGIATVEYGLHHFIISRNQQVRLMNLAVEGPREGRIDTRAKQLLGEFFDGMIKRGYPGATRVKSLCGFMADLDRPVPLTWKQISDLSRQVHEQLEGLEPIESLVVRGTPYKVKEPIKIPATVWAVLGGVALIGVVVLLLAQSQDKKKSEEGEGAEAPNPFIKIPAGEYHLSDGRVIEVREAFAIGRSEVTLAQYNAFLEFPDHAKFEHPEQPASKKDHLPDDWKELWASAVKGNLWRRRNMSTDCPVIGIDWWDAYAYAKWNQGRLPTMVEWEAAADFQGGASEVSAWGPADQSIADITGAGLVGMAGNVREWTLQSEINPSSPLSPKSLLLVGASFSDPAGGASARDWIDSRDERRDSLGFRVIIKKYFFEHL